MPIKRYQVGEVKSAMKRCNMRDLLLVAEREVQVIIVEMNQVEIFFFAENLVQHYYVMR